MFEEPMPGRIFLCPGCKSRFEKRWLLSRHLKGVHGLGKKKADDLAWNSEYWLSPTRAERQLILHQLGLFGRKII